LVDGLTRRFATRGAWLCLVLLVVCLGPGGVAARNQTLTTDEAKAAFVFNFAKYVEWPSKPNTDGSPLQVGVLGSDGVSDALREIVRGKTAGARSLTIRRVTLGDDLAGLHVLFVGASQKPRTAEILKRIGGSSVLTVSDMEQFCQTGGVIGLMLEDSHLRFEVNLEAAAHAQLKVSSRLLTLARAVLPAKAAGSR
jgi:YfiR/HmsC-like